MTVGCSKLMQNINFYIHYSLVHANSVIFLEISLKYFSSHLHSCLFPAVFLQLGICQVRSTLFLYFPKNWWKYWDFFFALCSGSWAGQGINSPSFHGINSPSFHGINQLPEVGEEFRIPRFPRGFLGSALWEFNDNTTPIFETSC